MTISITNNLELLYQKSFLWNIKCTVLKHFKKPGESPIIHLLRAKSLTL